MSRVDGGSAGAAAIPAIPARGSPRARVASRGAAMSDPRIRAKRILTHDVEFERLAETAATAALRAEYRAIAAQYRRLALAEANRADAADSAIRQSRWEIETRVSNGGGA